MVGEKTKILFDTREFKIGVRIQEQGLGFSEALDAVSAALLSRIRTRFLDQTDPDGRPWEPSFAAIRRAEEGRGGGTLFDTGNLFRSIQIASPDPFSRIIFTNVEYAAKLQDGKPPPARVFLGFSQDDISTVETVLNFVLTQQLEKAFK